MYIANRDLLSEGNCYTLNQNRKKLYRTLHTTTMESQGKVTNRNLQPYSSLMPESKNRQKGSRAPREQCQ